MQSSIQRVSPLRQRMLEDMRMRQLAPKTQSAYIRAVGKLAKFIGRSPETASAEDLRRFQLHLVDEGTSPITLNATIVGLNFFFEVTLGRPDAMAKMQSVRVPHKLPVVLSKEEVARLLGAVGHIKHQTALSLAYGTGLRVGEVVALRRAPRALGKTMASSPPSISRNHARRTSAVALVRGVDRSLRPLPTTRTCAPVPRHTPARHKPVISDRRNPV